MIVISPNRIGLAWNATHAPAPPTTSAIVARVSNGPAFGPLQHLPGVFLVPGGVLIKSGDDVVGAIGVGGAPGGDKDEVCAQAAVAKIADRLK